MAVAIAVALGCARQPGAVYEARAAATAAADPLEARAAEQRLM